MRSASYRWVAFLAAGLAGCQGGLDARSAAEALADEFGDWLGFDGGEEQEGAPPEEHADDPAYPQSGSLEGPEGMPSVALEPGQAFGLVVRTPEYYTARAVAGVALHVVQANKTDRARSWILVPESAAPYAQDPVGGGGLVRLSGALAAEERLRGNAFTVRTALVVEPQPGQFEAGNFIWWNVLVPAGTAPTRVSQCLPDSGSVYHDSEGSSGFVLYPRTLLRDASCPGVEPGVLWQQAAQGHNFTAQGAFSDFPSGTLLQPVDPATGRVYAERCFVRLDCDGTSTFGL